MSGGRPEQRASLGSLAPGTHLCAFHRDPADRTRIAATFVRHGLAAGDQLLYVTTHAGARALLAALPDHLAARDVVASGQLRISSFADTYGTRRHDDLDLLADGFRAAADQARKQGFPGLRVAAEMDDLAPLLGSSETVLEWERLCTGLQRELGVSSRGPPPARSLDDEFLELLTREHAGLAPEAAESPLARFLAVDEPWGVRIVGEVDLSNQELLHRLLVSRAAVMPRIHLDLEGLTFADVGTVSRLRSVAAGLPESGWLALHGVPAFVRRILDISGLHHDRLRLEP